MRDRSVDSEYYLVPPYSNEHVDEISSEDGVVTAAVFFFDFPLRGHDVLGRYGIFAVTSELSEILVKKGYSGFHLGEAQAGSSGLTVRRTGSGDHNM
ncbi:hypothetical protein SAMN04488550_4485 [Gordonia malaquae]|nr:hypothetical protein [Gordonia malaquae]SEE40624.1 hypothetical protein SAMN04488550_4485 [Gordonia malaquae]